MSVDREAEIHRTVVAEILNALYLKTDLATAERAEEALSKIVQENTGLRAQLDATKEALRTIREHDHPDACDGICADSFKDIAHDALAVLATGEGT